MSPVVHRGLEDPAVSVARVSREQPRPAPLVSEPGGGSRGGSPGRPPEPDQPPRHQAEDVELKEERPEHRHYPQPTKEFAKGIVLHR